ncbi:MAG: hypothetical protein ACHQJ6_06055 [Candidatus Berkiellales bacterium]
MSNNKQSFIFRCRSLQFVLALVCISSISCFATMDVMVEDTEGYWGNAETRPFKEVVEGNEALTEKDKAFLSGVEEQRVTERSYLRLLGGQPKEKLNGVQNKSSPPFDTLLTANASESHKISTLLIAAGHIWEHWAVELELLLTKTFNFTANPLVIDPATRDSLSATGSIKQYALTVNGSYIIPRWVSFYPKRLQIHLDAGLGGAVKTGSLTTVDNMTGFTLGTSSTRTITPVGMLGCGARYQVTTNFLVDIAYRFYETGKTRWKNVQIGPFEQSLQFQSNKMMVSGFFVGATYQV